MAEPTHAEAALRARDELMAVVAHDVKNPLTVVKGTADNLLRQLRDGRIPTAERLLDRIERIATAANRATALLDEMRNQTSAALSAATDGESDESPSAPSKKPA